MATPTPREPLPQDKTTQSAPLEGLTANGLESRNATMSQMVDANVDTLRAAIESPDYFRQICYPIFITKLDLTNRLFRSFLLPGEDLADQHSASLKPKLQNQLSRLRATKWGHHNTSLYAYVSPVRQQCLEP
jgi:hypothetical protein